MIKTTISTAFSNLPDEVDLAWAVIQGILTDMERAGGNARRQGRRLRDSIETVTGVRVETRPTKKIAEGS